ncbi:hypothetical protein [Hirschia litorea]|uniref:Cystatin domain-containing protein n=1 Tax=Hirschia litorea TaxID=1199156 RepID=A0ABW2IM42_9PROT
MKFAPFTILMPIIALVGCANQTSTKMPKSPALPPPPFTAPSETTDNTPNELEENVDHNIIAGGYAPADLSDENATRAKELMIDTIYRKFPTRALVDKVSAEVQVVAGLNYRFRIEMTGMPRTRDIFTGVVYMDLKQKMTVTSLEQIQGQ